MDMGRSGHKSAGVRQCMLGNVAQSSMLVEPSGLRLHEYDFEKNSCQSIGTANLPV